MRLTLFAALAWSNLLLAQQNQTLAIYLAMAQAILVVSFQKALQLSVRNAWLLAMICIAMPARNLLHAIGLSLPTGFEAVRDQVVRINHGISLDAQALVLGITIGDDSDLSEGLKQQMRDLSLSHLTAVSGTNCSILIAATFGLLAKAGFRTRGRVIGSLIALVLYLALVGDQPSVYRAAAMATFALLALLSKSRLNPIATLAASVITILLIDPTMASDYGFALSALATLGLLSFAPSLYQKLKARMPRWLALSISVSLSAQLFCLPVLATLQPEQSSVSIVANVFVEPVVAIITLVGMLATVCSLISPWLASLLFWLASLPAQYIVAVTKFLASLDAPTVEVSTWVLLLAVLVVALVALTQLPRLERASKFVISLVASTLIALQLSSQLSGVFPIKNWVYASCDVGQGDATVIRSRGATAVIDVGREPKIINRCLNRLGIKSIDLLVLTHFHADHVAGLAGAIRNRSVNLALVSSFPDERPGANWIQDQLRESRIKYFEVKKGDRGKLGDFSWLVLSPHRDGEGSEDPNDGSVTMLWQSANINVVTLADLGEKGQMRLGEELDSWDNPNLHKNPTILKVSHHGSADQFAELYEWLKPTIATISAGKANSYGHPTRKTLKLLSETSSHTLRTDQLGGISIAQDGKGNLVYSSD